MIGSPGAPLAPSATPEDDEVEQSQEASEWEPVSFDERLDEYVRRVLFGIPLTEDLVTRTIERSRTMAFETQRSDITLEQIQACIEQYFANQGFTVQIEGGPAAGSSLDFRAERTRHDESTQDVQVDEVRGEVTVFLGATRGSREVVIYILNDGPKLSD